MPSNAYASARVLHHQVDGSTLAQFYRSATKHLSRDQLVKGLLVIKAVLDQSLVDIFAWEADLGKLREWLQVGPADSFITWGKEYLKKKVILTNRFITGH